MITQEMKNIIIDALKKDGVFIPEDNAYNDILRELEGLGFVNVLWNKFPSEHPFSAEATISFKRLVRLKKSKL